MYCPSCGTETTDDRKYCRACGVNLHAVSELLTGQPRESSNTGTTGSGEKPRKRRKVLGLGFILTWAGLVLGCLLAALGDSVSSVNKPVGDLIANLGAIGAIIMMAGIGVMIYSRFLPKTPVLADRPKPKALSGPAQAIDLPPKRIQDGLISVAEHTTFKLEDPTEKTQKG
jgi:hypothetical protein